MKEILMKGMNSIMLDCEHASSLVTKSEFVKLSCIKRMQLKMHLASCKFCRAFADQSKIINSQLEDIKNIDEDNLNEHLTHEQKEEIQETLDATLKEN